MNFYCPLCQHIVEGVKRDTFFNGIHKARVTCLECATTYSVKNNKVFDEINGLTHTKRDKIISVSLNYNKKGNRVLHLARK